ncbi:Adenylylsulphate kinase [Rhabdaerophilaceae bacterium]
MSALLKPIYIHATALSADGCGVLITGRSRSGKSTLADRLIDALVRQGISAKLVGDDRIGLTMAGHKLIARPHPAIAGLIERRGSGIHSVSFVDHVEIMMEIALESIGSEQQVDDGFVERLPGHRMRRVILSEKPELAAVLPLVLALRAQ